MAMTGPNTGDGRDKRPRVNPTRHPLTIAVFPALILGLCTLAGGYFAGTRHVLGGAPAPTVTVTVTRPATSTPSDGGTSNAPGQEMFHKSGVQLTDCYALSITDPSLRPYRNSSCGSPLGDLSINYNGDVQSMAQVAVYPGRAGFSQCQAGTAYAAVGATINVNNLTNSTLCITTASRIATCYVTDDTTFASVAAPGLTMDVTVYALK
jgi:hypothetical protein